MALVSAIYSPSVMGMNLSACLCDDHATEVFLYITGHGTAIPWIAIKTGVCVRMHKFQ